MCILEKPNFKISWGSMPPDLPSLQAQWKQFRVGPAKIGSSAGGVSTLEGSGGMDRFRRACKLYSLFGRTILLLPDQL